MNNIGKKKIAVMGAGAVGSLIGGILACHGQDVTLIGRKDHITAVQSNGLFIDGVLGEYTIAIKTAEQLAFKPDIIFLAVKTQDLESACRDIKPNAAGVPVVLMQNGVRSIDIASGILGKHDIVSCILLLNARFVTPGTVTCMNKEPIIIGKASGENKKVIDDIRSLLNPICDTTISDDIRGAQWTKLLINAMANGIDAMTGLSLGEYMQDRRLRRIGVMILKEALMLLDKAGIGLARLPGIPLSAFKALISLPTPVAAFLLQFAIPSKGNKKVVTST
ncbi:MAG: NAD(P)-binding domain-containing protein, partial [Proteobacteria bacterium]|nr:NAD(P)-binding domain-containing protein [Pseudomonadota bacterium]